MDIYVHMQRVNDAHAGDSWTLPVYICFDFSHNNQRNVCEHKQQQTQSISLHHKHTNSTQHPYIKHLNALSVICVYFCIFFCFTYVRRTVRMHVQTHSHTDTSHTTVSSLEVMSQVYRRKLIPKKICVHTGKHALTHRTNHSTSRKGEGLGS